ncbi:reverse transcriptase [Gossypium australe]|uniref:Reverse transcriptase n=1 Tax=Gossypium australe TaxID=47621 RepID=A0A5B6W2U2_9ROSI|nr:reverse transcriptase [Gossypium australe]
METKLNKKQMEKARRSCGFNYGIDIEAEGSRGGLCLAWKSVNMVTLRSYSKWHIDVLVREGCTQQEWRFTGFYGSPYLKDKNFVWNLLRRLSQDGSYPWLVAGDFNEILYSFEKSGGAPRDHKRMEAFRDTLEDQLVDIGFSGTWFTWERGNLPETNIRERLDRGWQMMRENQSTCSGPGRFRFEAWWSMEETFEGLLKEFWFSCQLPLWDRLMRLQLCLKDWAGSIRRGRVGIKKRLTKELEFFLGQERDDETMSKIIDTKIHLNLEIDREEVYWEQRARVNWLQLGDKNTAYFHKWATSRKMTNSITKLLSDDGREITEASTIIETATEFFENLFASQDGGDSQKVLDGIQRTISNETNEFLLSPFREEEVWAALKSGEVMKFCLGILNEGKGVGPVNATEIVLIPKIPNPSTLVNFRPISLCSVLYKIVAKTIANRLQNVIGGCIDEVQSAFVPGRLITDNVLLAYEILHTFRQKRTGLKGFMAVKLDMSKAYDRVEWDFVKKVMLKMGFEQEWVGLIMKCISSVSYAVNINGHRGLSSLMRIAKKSGLVKGVKVSRKGPEISHLLFADDCMMFGEATEQGAKNMKDILNEYAKCSGQCVNFNKSTIFYSSNTSQAAKESVTAMLGVRNSSNPEKYLGLPNMLGKKKKAAFQNILDKISLKIDSWSTRFLSQGGKEIFIKSVLQAIPTYPMSCFLLPKTLCEMIEGKLARFWWQKGAGKRGIHWCKWSHLCRSKEEGGLGFRNMAQFNVALLAKQGWRLLTSPNSLVARVFKAKYYPDCGFRDSHLGNSSSYVWRSIWAAKATLEMGLIWRVGSGEKISVFNDAWIPKYGNVRLIPYVDNLHFVKVAELINSNQRKWNRSLIESTFPANEAELILQIPLTQHSQGDLLVWAGELSGEFSVRSSYKLLQNNDPTVYDLQDIYDGFYSKLWKIDIPLKIKLFIWKISLNYIATRVNMSFRNLTSSSLCPRCGSGEETTNHLFRVCPTSVMIWSDLPEIVTVFSSSTDFVEWLTKTLANLSLTELDAIRRVNQSTLTETVKWRSPLCQTVKINFDGAFDARFKLSASGVVVRDHQGFALLSSTELHEGVVSPFVAEAIACRRATQLALEINNGKVIIEGDSLSIIKKCNTNVIDKSQVGSFIHDIQELKNRVPHVRFEFVPRSANTLAHILATETLRRKESVYLENGVPPYAENQLKTEYAREPD